MPSSVSYYACGRTTKSKYTYNCDSCLVLGIVQPKNIQTRKIYESALSPKCSASYSLESSLTIDDPWYVLRVASLDQKHIFLQFEATATAS